MKRLRIAAIALPLLCCMTSCGSTFTKADVFRTLKAAGIGALQGAFPAAATEIRVIRAEKELTKQADGKAAQTVLP